MRVTDNRLYIKVQQQLQARKQKLDEAANRVASGKIIDRLEQNTSIVRHVLRNDNEEDRLEQYADSLRRIKDSYSVYETNIDEVYNALSSLKSVMMGLNNPYYQEETRQDMKLELEQTKELLLSLANAMHEGKYIYSGSRSDVEAFAEDGTYQGDSNEMKVEILPGVKMEHNITGEELFGGIGLDNGENVFYMIDEILAGIETGDPQGSISSHMDDIDQLIEQNIHERSRVGIRLARVETSESTLSRLEISLAEKRNNTEDADYVDAITEYQMQEFALQAAMQTNASLLQHTLLNFLK